jgi:hypothetical protein
MDRNEQCKIERDVALDITRGMCVFVMAVHHCINYFPGYPLTYWRFVTGAFPFLAGYLVTSILRKRHSGIQAEGLVGLKLLTRGGKLLLICFSLNLIIRAVLPEMTKHQSESIFEVVKVVFFSGDYKSVSFSLLIPIGYVLCFGGVLSMLQSCKSMVLVALTCFLLIYCSLRHFSTETGYYLSYFVIGMTGMVYGLAHKGKVAELEHKLWLPIALWVLSFISISLWGQQFPLFALYVFTTVVLCYAVSTWAIGYKQLSSMVALHGQYSLLLYLCQIVFLVAAKVFISSMGYRPGIIWFWVTLAMMGIMQWGVAATVHYFRGKKKSIDTLYRLVFA